ncbi:MAG: YkgJ family cysteine cluster protein [Intestinibacter sp.]|uniref:YkgJ family cysteine cluster protein n=1 Tax=Intestinibacter sp. TaxID=1965304 RepID=UPI0025B8EC10|nr:YkgJ family cysteine cluster protein [Intestinibacter sp.]MCI6737143.1 YkgJ family cysteine cluster protein [Intestinibacter sp.]
MTSIKKSQILESIEFCEKKGYFKKLNDIYSKLPKGDCSGCGNCCMESVGINLIEFLNIYKYLMDRNELRRASIDKIIDYYFLELLKKNSCPFKDDNNRCLIYEVRPLNCRLFGHWEKKDYNKNLQRVIKQNMEYKDAIKEMYDIDISEEVLSFSIKYCEKFKPELDYLSKQSRLSFCDEVMSLDSRILGSGLIDIDYRDRGIVEYFIEYLMNSDFAYKIKIRITKENNTKVVDRIKKIYMI